MGRAAILAGVIALAGGLASGCRCSKSSSTSSDTIALAWEAEPRTIDPRYASDADSQYLAALLHCSLVTFDAEGKVIAELAESWNWANDKSLNVTLKKDITFSDGTPVTAEDVKATYDFVKRADLKVPTPLAGSFSNLAGVAVVNPGTVRFDLATPDSTFVANLVVGTVPSRYSDEMIQDMNRSVGCGAYVLASPSLTNIELKRNPFFKLGTPPKANVLIKVVKDESTRFAKLRSGELDIVQNLISRDKLADIARQNPDLKVLRRQGLNVTYLGFNMRDPNLGKVEVRRAIAHAINRAAIIEYIMQGLATPATGILTPPDPFRNPDLAVPEYSTEKAIALLDKAGVKVDPATGIRFEVTYKTTTNATRLAIAKAVAADLDKVGIKVRVLALEWGRFKKDVEEGQVQLWSLAWIGYKDPDILRFAFGSDNFPPAGGNRGWYSNARLDALLAQGRQLTNPEARKKVYFEAQSILAEEMPYVFLWHEELFAVVSRQVQNFDLYADGRLSGLVNATKVVR